MHPAEHSVGLGQFNFGFCAILYTPTLRKAPLLFVCTKILDCKYNDAVVTREYIAPVQLIEYAH